MTARTYKIGAREIAHHEIVEVETIAGIFGATNIHVGRLIIANDDRVYIEVLQSSKLILQDKIRSIRVLTPQQLAARYHEGDNVRICRFGNVYGGTVEKVHRTRVSVRFQTNKDRRERTSHLATVPAVELVRMS